MINLIACMDKNRGIGKDNAMPWHLPKELKYFKETTQGHIVVMGRKTYKSIGEGGLPKRDNIVLTNEINGRIATIRSDYSLYFTNSIDYVIDLKDYREVFVIGGANVYEQFIPYADRLYITRINAEFGCDTFFPDLYHKDWKIVDYRIDEDKGFELEYHVYDRHKKE
jgi:dihydrofolate reductase